VKQLRWVVLPVIILVAWISDHFAADGTYEHLLTGWSYLGWTSIFLVYLWVFRSVRIAFANIFITSIVQDLLLNSYRDWMAGVPWHVHIGGADHIYGEIFKPLAGEILGVNSGYVIMGGLAIILYCWPMIKRSLK